MDILNLNNLTVDKSGRASFSGLTSGVDFVGAVDSIIEAKRIPIVTLENRVTENTDKITALNDLKGLLQALENAASGLRGAVTIDGTGDFFKDKQAFSTVSRTDGKTPSAAGNLIGVSVTGQAATGSHQIEIRRSATAHKISSQAYADQTVALNLSGSFTISSGTVERTITVVTSDSLLDIRDRINNANTGTTASKVSASVVSVSSSEHFLVLTKDDAGADIVITDSGSVLSGLGLSSTNGKGGFRNGLPTGTGDGQSKIETADGFKQIVFDGTQDDNSFLISYDGSTRIMTLTRGDGITDSVTLATAAIATGSVETASFEKFGVSIVLDENFSKTTSIAVDADTATIGAGGTGAINATTIKISDSIGDISAINSTTLTFSSLATPSAITITAGGFSGTFDGTATGLKTVNLSDGGGNTLQIQFNVTTVFNGSEGASSIDLQELENLAVADGAAFSNVLQKAQTARFTADGLKDSTHFESQRQTSATASITSTGGTFDIVGTATQTITFVSGETLTTLASKINAQTASTGVTATVVADSDGFRLDFDSSTAFALTDTSSLLASLAVNDDLVIERATNTVSDVFQGVTLSLFQEEQGTSIKLDIVHDLSSVKTAIQGLVTAYNDVRVFINTQNAPDPATGLKGENSGVLFGNSVMNDLRDQLSNLVGLGTAGVSSDFAALAQVGVKFVDNNEQSDSSEFNTLEIDETTLDAALLSNIDDIRKLFGFDFSSSDPNVTLVDFTKNTTYSSSGYTLNIGTIGAFDQNSTSIVDKTKTLNDANSFNDATGAGSFTVNGVTVNYDTTTDTLQTLVNTINNDPSNNATASIVTDTTGAHLHLTSTVTPFTVADVSGTLVASMGLTADTTIIDSANIGGASSGADDSSATTSGLVLTVTSNSGAEGLKVLYSGPASTSGIQLNFTTGIGSRLFFTLDSALDATTGVIQGEIASLEGQNIFAESRIKSADERLDILRDSLTSRFIVAEQALARMNNVIEQIKQTFQLLSGNN